jgi:hypothetical protein
MYDSVQQCARFSRIARDTLPEDPVAAERSGQLDTVRIPQQIHQAPIFLFDGAVDDIERGDSHPARDFTHLDVMKTVAAAFRGLNPNDGAIFRNTLQRPRRSVKLGPVTLTSL